MDDLINRQVLIATIANYLWGWDTEDGVSATTVLKQVITAIINAPVVEPNKGKWISVKDRLPKKDGKYLCVIDGDKINPPYVMQWYFYCGKFESFEYYDTRYVSHWMPLPELPKCGADMKGEE